MNELRPDLTIKEIDAELKDGETFELESDGSTWITLAQNNLQTRPIPTSWLKPKVKKLVAKKGSDLVNGDILFRCGKLHEVKRLTYINEIHLRVDFLDYSFVAHVNEFVTVEVEE